MTITRIISNRYFAIFDLSCVVFSIGLWELRPDFTWIPVCLALLPWVIRLLAGKPPFQRMPVDIFTGLFIITAGIGVWAAYNPADAWAKFWLIIGGVLLFYAIAGQPAQNKWTLIWFFGLIGVGISFYFLFTQDWQVNPAKIGLLNRIGFSWMKIRPDIHASPIDHDNAAGLMAISVPFFIVLLIKSWREKRFLFLAGALAGLSVISAGYVMATSRSASIALFLGLAIGSLWLFAVTYGAARYQWINPKVISVVFFLLLVGSGILILIFDNSLHQANNAMAFSDISSRPVLIRSTLELMRDFFLTGSGLGSFPGLYSHYILGIPYFYIENSRNLFLDVGLEQGLLGLFAFCWIYVHVIWLYINRKVDQSNALLSVAVVAGLSIILLNNIVEDTLYSPGVAPLIFILPGMAYFIYKMDKPDNDLPRKSEVRLYSPAILGAGALSLAIIGLLIVYRQSITAAWNADVGSIQMAKIELVDFPNGKLDAGLTPIEIARMETQFKTALQSDPTNITSAYRLGLIAMMKRDYLAAVVYLNNAYLGDPGNRGVTKMLGYSYAWSGDLDKSEALLNQLSESKQEMETYAWWWNTQGRSDLASYAKVLAKRLE